MTFDISLLYFLFKNKVIMKDLKNSLDDLPNGDIPENIKDIKNQESNEKLDQKMLDVSKKLESSFEKDSNSKSNS